MVMSQPVLVRGHLTRWSTIAARAIGPLCVLAGAIALVVGPQLAIPLLALGMLFALSVEIWLWQVRRGRVWVEDTGNGFRVTDRAGVREYRDEQAVSLGYYQKRVYAEGVLKSSWRYFLVWV